MKQRYHLKGKGYVDLYFNDFQGLKKSIENIFMENKTTLKNKNVENFRNLFFKNEFTEMSISDLIELCKIKFLLFTQDYDELEKVLIKLKDFHHYFSYTIAK